MGDKRLANLSLTKKNLLMRTHAILAILLFSSDAIFFSKSNLVAQNLSLFEELESSTRDAISRGSARNSGGEIISEPNFTLVGTARFGDHYSAIINNGDERNILLDSTSDSTMLIPGHPGYRILDIRSGEISIRYPTDRACVSSEDKGISCSDANTAKLRLTNIEPIKSVKSDVARVGNGIRSEPNAPENPFAALLEEASNSESINNETSSFTPRRINQDDVPSGMRVVSTPFGDRLVEE